MNQISAARKANSDEDQHARRQRDHADSHAAASGHSEALGLLTSPGPELGPPGVLAMQTVLGNNAVAREFDGMTIQRKEIKIGSETVEVHSRLGIITKRGQAEKKEAEEIINTLKDTYGIEVSSSTLIEGIKQQYNKVPKKVTNALKARKWRMIELRALADALKNYAPILGKARESSTRKGEDQEVVAVGKGAQAIDTNKPTGELDTTTLGEYFRGKKVMGMFKASEGFNDAFDNEKDELVGTFVHEIAHGLLAYAYDDFVKNGSGGYWLDQDTESGTDGAEEPPTDYGHKNAREDLCDSIALYFVAPGKLKNAPLRQAFMEKLGKAWLPPLKEAPPQLGGASSEPKPVESTVGS